MKQVKLIAFGLAGSTLLAACAEDPTQPQLTPDQAMFQTQAGRGDLDLDALRDQVPSKHLVMFKGRAPGDFEAQVTALGGTVSMNHEIGIAVVLGLDEAGASQLKTNSRAQHVEPIAELQLIAPAGVTQPTPVSLGGSMMLNEGVNSTEDPAGAILFANQWNMRQVHADDAWAAGRLGSPGVTVAILDTGIDYLLPDLEGLVDLSRSTSFEPLDDLLTGIFFPGRDVSTDLHYHGTNVATQVSSNAWAFAGVTSKTTLMSVKVCSALGGCSGVIEGILYAIDNGADVINMSLGGWFRKSAFPGQVAAYNAIMNYAKQQGVTIVVAAGNDANDLDRQNNIAIRDANGNIIDRVHVPSFFATYCDANHVICVSATRMDDVSASYTNYGRSAIDVAAPGGDSGEWVYALCPQTSLVFFCEDGYYTLGVAGTSQATPHVSGLAALAVEDVGRNVARVRSYIRNSADAIVNGNSPYYGKGRINVARAVGAQ